MIVKESDLENIPQPFLNRFEKYRLSHEIVLEAVFSNLPPALAQLLRAVVRKVKVLNEIMGFGTNIILKISLSLSLGRGVDGHVTLDHSCMGM